mgnify:CR=1 FL=1
MAESESGQDKTEDPTDKRKRDSREKGEIARSKELNTVAVTLAGAGGLLMFGGWTNALPYLLRGFGINAFVMGGNALQRVSAGMAGLSVLAIIIAWAVLAWNLWKA